MEAAGLGAPRRGGRWAAGSPTSSTAVPRLQVGALLAGPVGWLVIGYLGLARGPADRRASGRSTTLSGEIVSRTSRSTTSRRSSTSRSTATIAWRTVLIAALVTVTDALLALPDRLLHGEGRERRGRRALLVVAVLMPLWSSYLVKVYAWRTMLSARTGSSTGCSTRSGCSGPGYGNVAVWLVMSYLWLPYMILPIYAGLERIPNSLLDASERPRRAARGTTFRSVILPLVFPADRRRLDLHLLADARRLHHAAAGLQRRSSSATSSTRNITNNLPLAAAFATVPIVIMIVYLLIARRLGAFEHV